MRRREGGRNTGAREKRSAPINQKKRPLYEAERGEGRKEGQTETVEKNGGRSARARVELRGEGPLLAAEKRGGQSCRYLRPWVESFYQKAEGVYWEPMGEGGGERGDGKDLFSRNKKKERRP